MTKNPDDSKKRRTELSPSSQKTSVETHFLPDFEFLNLEQIYIQNQSILFSQLQRDDLMKMMPI